MSKQKRQSIVIIGIGNSLRRDDGVGPLALDACKYDPVPGADLVELDGEATRVIEAWRERDLAIVIDAICTGEPAGTLHDLTIDELDDVNAPATGTSSHAVGLADALALGRELDRLPGSLRVLGIEPGDLKQGFGLSPPVAAMMDELVDRVRAAAAVLTNDEVA